MEVILWIILDIVVLRIIARYPFPYILKYFLKKFQQKIFNQNFGSETQQKEGDTVINFAPEKKNQDSDHIGEYVDYEEIKK